MRERGFTLPEAMVVVGIIGILAMLALPSMSRLLTTQAVRSSSYDLFADLIFARSEAIARGTNVSVMGAGAPSTDWKQGWTIRDVTANTVLRTQPASSSAITFTASNDTITFDRTGRATNSATATFNIVPVDTGAQDYMKRCVRIDPSGRPRTAEGACP